MDKYIKHTVVLLLTLSHCYSSPMDHERVPEDVTRFKNFLEEFDKGEIRLMPTLQLLRGRFPLTFETEGHHHREKREIGDSESDEPVLTEQRGSEMETDNDDDTIKHYVRSEINRIFSCYQRLRCGHTRAQAEQECKWLEQSSLYHQLMRIMGIKNYPKKKPVTGHSSSVRSAQSPPSQSHGYSRGQEQPRRVPPTPAPVPSDNVDISDAAINPLHQNLQNGIKYGGVRPGQYKEGIALSRNRNRRYYDSFFTETELSPLVSPSS